MTRGMTLLEVLLSLALLGGIAIACASWIATAARGTETTAERLRWRSAADATLTLIGDQLTIGDFKPEQQVRFEPPRVTVTAASLQIDTRLNGRAATAAIELTDNRLTLTADDERLLLADVAAFEVELDEETQVLTVTLRSTMGDEQARRYTLP